MAACKEKEAIKINAYYRFTGAATFADAGEIVDGLVLVCEADYEGDEVCYVSGDTEFSCSVDAFLSNFEFDPDGDRKRMERIQSLLSENLADQQDVNNSQEAFLLSGGSAVGEPSTSAYLVPAGDLSNATHLKQVVSEAKNHMTTCADRMKLRMELVSTLMAERQTALNTQLAKYRDAISRMSELVWTIDIYLGRSETLVQLRKGESAPAEAKIAIRQMVLWMAEECAVASESGGIDHRTIEEFDKWLLESPAHLDQVLPDQKGIVLLKPTRVEKLTEDPWRDAHNKKANRHSYFLVKNGQNLYRIDTDLEVGETLFPTSTEFDELFETEETQYHDRFGTYNPVRIRAKAEPGSSKYADAMEESEWLQRHYMRVLLFIQGIIHRTHVFEPTVIPREQINVMDRAAGGQYMTFIHDAENLLGSGRPTFDEWLSDVNGELEVGHRIIGAFSTYYARQRQDFNRDRMRPRNATQPKDLAIYTLEDKGRADGEFIFRYVRSEEIFSRGDHYRLSEYRQPKVRASCTVYKTDKFILNFDGATVEDMQYYLTNRFDRRSFISMFPLLKTAIRMKIDEERREAPFRKLLIGQVSKAHELSIEDVEPEMDELIHWWKFKNRTHRALTSKDRTALSMIVAEFGIRQKRKAERLSRIDLHNAVADEIRRLEAGVVYVGHKRENEYVALSAHNQYNIFVKEQTWRKGRGGLTKTEEKEWRVVDKRRLRWFELYSSPRWSEWSFDARELNYLTDPERARIMEDVWPEVEELARDYHKPQRSSSRERAVNPVYKPLAVVSTGFSRGLRFYACYQMGKRDHAKPFSGEQSTPKVLAVHVGWEKSPKGVEFVTHRYYDLSYSPDKPPWGDCSTHMGMLVVVDNRKPLVWWKDQPSIDEMDRAFEDYALAKARRSKITSVGWAVARFVRDEMDAIAERIAFADFMAEFHDAALWPKHKESLDLGERGIPHEVYRAASYAVEAGLPVNGLTVGQLFERAAELGYRPEEVKAASEESGAKQYPLDLVIQVDEAGAGDDE